MHEAVTHRLQLQGQLRNCSNKRTAFPLPKCVHANSRSVIAEQVPSYCCGALLGSGPLVVALVTGDGFYDGLRDKVLLHRNNRHSDTGFRVSNQS